MAARGTWGADAFQTSPLAIAIYRVRKIGVGTHTPHAAQMSLDSLYRMGRMGSFWLISRTRKKCDACGSHTDRSLPEIFSGAGISGV